MTSAPPSGSVLGVDVGYSPTRSSSAVCRLDWTSDTIRWTIRRFRYIHTEIGSTIAAVAGPHHLLAAAFDGPLAHDLAPIRHYRPAEQMLTRRLAPLIGKPGASNTPVGRKLNEAANMCAAAVLAHTSLAPAAHPQSIHARALVEAFPSAFLGLMLAQPATLGTVRNTRSDVYFQHLTDNGTLHRLLARLLPARTPIQHPTTVTNHDDRAALICALTALCVAAGDYIAVGDPSGRIILPPRHCIQDWAWAHLQANAAANPDWLCRSR